MRSQNTVIQVFKYAEDTAIVGLLNHLQPDNFILKLSRNAKNAGAKVTT